MVMSKGNEIQIAANNVSLIAAGTEIQGEISCAGDLRVDGKVNGTLNARGKVVIGEAGRVEGEVNCRNCDISGYLKGKIGVQELLALKSTAKLNGDISTKRLSIEPGGIFSGNCAMGEEAHAPQQSATPAK